MMSSKTAIFTIVSANYIAYAATLMQSVRRFHPDLIRFIILSDARHSFHDIDLAAELIACDELGITLLGNMKLWYSITEFNTAVKPYTFNYLFSTRGFEAAIYLDPDIQLYSPIDEIVAGLAGHSLVLTPHITRPLQDSRHPSDLAIMKSGIYNLGFAAIANDEDGRGLIQWWCDRLFAHCRVDIPGNIFTDQRWMDLAPAFVTRTKLLRHPGYNVAYWNLIHRTVDQDAEGVWRANGERLAFFHFSGISPTDSSYFSKHQNRFTSEKLGPVAGLCDDYRARVIANGWLTYNKIPYAYDTFPDGQKILDPMRHWLLEAVDDGRLAGHQPLILNAAFFEVADDQSFAGGGRLTRFAHQAWRDRADLREAFSIRTADGLNNFIDWFCGESAEREGVPPSQVQAARELRETPSRVPEPPLRLKLPPWKSLSTTFWKGAARDAAEWLQGEIEFPVGIAHVRLQRQAALLWELRTDLQHHFRLDNSEEVESFQSWVITEGMRQGSIRADLLTSNYVKWFDSADSISQLCDDVPISRGMTLTRKCPIARNGMEAWSRFPLDERARLEHAFWFAFLAPSLFAWPAEMTASVRAYFQGPSKVSVEGFTLSRGMLAPYEIREDVRSFFDIRQNHGRWAYLGWLLDQGVREFGLNPVDFGPELSAFMSAASSLYPTLSRWAVFAHDRRDDLKALFELSSHAGIAGMEQWERSDLVPWLILIGLFDVLVPPQPFDHPPPKAHSCSVVLSGSWSVISGLGEDMRLAVAALKAVDFRDYVIVDLVSKTIITADGGALEPGTPVRAEWNVVFHNADTALDDWNTLRTLHVDTKNVAGRWHWELERIPSWWKYAFSFVDEVWAPSDFVTSIFRAEDRRPIRLLHHAVTVPRVKEAVSRFALGLLEDVTVFLVMFDFSSFVARKNPGGVIAAFLRAFPRGDERVQLVIKTQNAQSAVDQWNDLARLTNDPRVVWRNVRLSRTELTNLLATSNAFVSLHRSEGFGRGPAEAMLLGVPVILTGYSGTVEFTNSSCACIVDFTMVPVSIDQYPGVERQLWAEPDIGQAAHWMHWVHTEPKAARQMGQLGRQRVAEMLSPSKIGADFLTLLNAERPSNVAEIARRDL